MRLRIIEAALPPNAAESSPVERSVGSMERLLGAVLRARGTNDRVVDVQRAADLLGSMGLRVGDDRALLAARTAADLLAREIPLTPELIRGGIALRSGALEKSIAPLERALVTLVERHLNAGPEREVALRGVARIVEQAFGVVDRAAIAAPARVAVAIDQLIRQLTAHDPEITATRGVLESLRASSDRGATGQPLEGRVLQLLAEPDPRAMRTAERAPVSLLRDLSPVARSQALETMVHMEREQLESKTWFAEFRSVARELMSRAEALAHQQWLDLPTLDSKETLFFGSGVHTDPDGHMPFRMTVTDEREDEDGELGFRISIDSKRLGRIEIKGRLNSSDNERLSLDFLTDDPITGQQVATGLESLIEALGDVGYDATATAKTRTRPALIRTVVQDPSARLDLQA